jgi:hypothetical protein
VSPRGRNCKPFASFFQQPVNRAPKKYFEDYLKKALLFQKGVLSLLSQCGAQRNKGRENKMTTFKTLENSSTIATTGLYETTVFQIGKTKVIVTKYTSTCGLSDAINICVMNASNRAWGGIGKRFESVDKALQHYKAKNMQAILNTYK